jgi:hypothetical protein
VAVFEEDTRSKLTLAEPDSLSPLSDESAEDAHHPTSEHALEFQCFAIHHAKLSSPAFRRTFQIAN